MKRKNLLFAVLTATAVLWTTDAQAQNDYKYSFEGDIIADGWRVMTTGNSPYPGEHFTRTWRQWGEEALDGGETFIPHDGEKQMFVFLSNEKQDERFISPKLKLENNAELTFWHGIDQDKFSDVPSVWAVEISADGGNTWTEIWRANKRNIYETAETVNLSAYAGKTINLSWRAYDDNGILCGWFVDDITVSNVAATCDVVLEDFKDSKAAVINVVKETLGIGLNEAENLVGSAPCILTETITEEDADAFVKAVNEAGGVAKMASAGAYNPKFVSIFESFEGDVLPEGWSTIDADNDGLNWKTEKIPDLAFFGKYMITSRSYFTDEIAPDNYLVSPLLDDVVEVNYRFAMNPRYADNYQVLASKSGKNVADFTEVLITERPENLVESVLDFGFSAWEERTLSLPAGTKYVAFRHGDSKGHDFISIDNIRFIKGLATGIETVNTDSVPAYGKGIYSINGVMLSNNWDTLPKGLYIVDGKKKVKN
ncbi:MAG: ribosomal protein L7/L12 [Prevotella sp.]|uniref:ribosomal protein L7/L12 n=1 Tax=Prevotella sp. TaxID=59823 RepID=UPI002A2E4ACC|nr:ribosomal protein L7/L12 [Prevotella sp.]MDD7317396.1 ribosomal protein L7/L12 [Prevotellaceae bacterium]MDY4019494.1 ribosomal protein L7/L12 [Prevotella sp.]